MVTQECLFCGNGKTEEKTFYSSDVCYQCATDQKNWYITLTQDPQFPEKVAKYVQDAGAILKSIKFWEWTDKEGFHRNDLLPAFNEKNQFALERLIVKEYEFAKQLHYLKNPRLIQEAINDRFKYEVAAKMPHPKDNPTSRKKQINGMMSAFEIEQKVITETRRNRQKTFRENCIFVLHSYITYFMKTIIFHHNDLDGIGAAAIVLSKNPSAECIAVDYNLPFPQVDYKGANVFMLDFCAQPEVMADIALHANSFTWIDHHKTSIARMEESGLLSKINAITSEVWSTIALAWKHIIGEVSMPMIITQLHQWDTWIHNNDPAILQTQYGMRALAQKPTDTIWTHIIAGIVPEAVLVVGNAILAYNKGLWEAISKITGYETTFLGHKAIVINNPLGNSLAFQSRYVASEHQLMVNTMFKQNSVTFSLYTEHPEIDCSELAKPYGGGGHKGAAGFNVSLEKAIDLLNMPIGMFLPATAADQVFQKEEPAIIVEKTEEPKVSAVGIATEQKLNLNDGMIAQIAAFDAKIVTTEVTIPAAEFTSVKEEPVINETSTEKKGE